MRISVEKLGDGENVELSRPDCKIQIRGGYHMIERKLHIS